MNIQEIIANKSNVDKVYIGRKAGCMCGCNGRYVEATSGNFERTFKQALQMLEGGIVEVDSNKEYHYTELETGRVVCIYFNGGVQ